MHIVIDKIDLLLNWCFFFLSENLTVGSVCADDRQCTGTKFATCIFGVCTCRSGYILIDYDCFKGN